MDAAQITKDLRAALEQEPRVDLEHSAVHVAFNDGTATLEGEVGSIAAKRLTLEHAAALPAVTAIVDRLRVEPAEAMGDDAIADHLEQALGADTVFAECSVRRSATRDRQRDTARDGRRWWIDIDVEDGVVTLDGEVPSLSHKRLGGVLAWWVPGTRDVVNGLGVEPDERDSDDEVLDALRIVLEKDPLVEATQISAQCRDFAITLRGLVPSDAVARAAENDAWALFGVDQVYNELEVRP